MIVIPDPRVLIQALAASEARLLAIDGWPLSGKSWFARSAARCLGARWVDLDPLVEKESDGFVQALDPERLADALLVPQRVMVSGVCMREALALIGSPQALHVYVKRMHHGYWTDEEESSDPPYAVDQVLQPSALRVEIRAYHAHWRPHLTAQYVYERTVDALGR